MTDVAPDEVRLAAEIERLKAEFPKTRELYREVCALMFFRYGITPTANRLYQLVRRGSMSTPTAVLSEFWATLREKSRVRIEHADLPEELRGAAGELIGALWTRATAAAQASLEALRREVEDARRAAEGVTAAVRADLAHTEVALEQRTAALLTAQVRIQELEQAQAAAAATRGALEAELAREREAGGERDTALTQARADFAAERDRLRASAELAETRWQAAEKRAQLEIERERTANARLQRDAETATQRAARTEESARAEIQALQAQLGDLRHQVGMLEGRLDALRSTREAHVRERETRAATAAAKPLRAARKTGQKA
ncbi:DNA-binding protein [Paraburkholderia silvatlantica]|uniref:Chromosome segregation ATPase n=1 Tax=Paraburkholderia silvatlantica TaxID=321895 RepID=A0A2U1A541_9BURK|nr:DNA-binding protein [Paraburkholderia silvatlantica]MBB2926186.1 chromosome segregation ATPase [Paraburkholderia silvatlantica]PVY26740.1 plasmid replication DNA-binding protein KfrA [Paraburkholderia silvatlantica]PXW33027.1 plasmid replication DNA-binding protein KfrA [Paraburkholderia silvatlantica]PYE15268.1 plasmid replication DNA-binding protein KfrA [Paraburkholderia silvatlantica]TDQ80687.1 plasmid replication DNA-binding protein KfrA [Paraburkholderia silvatlantica]